MSDTLVVNEIYASLQGESTWSGLPCIFVRLTGCPLRCSYCDTAYAFRAGRRMSLADIRSQVEQLAAPFRGQSGRSPAAARPPVRLPIVELTGGEPLLQINAPALMQSLADEGYTVLLETSGALDISRVDRRVCRILDLKCPSSGEVDRNRWANLDHLLPTDEIKCVIGTREDYAWARRQVAERRLDGLCPVLFSGVSPLDTSSQDASLKPVPPGQHPITRRELAEAILADALPVRFQLQMHKFIWPASQPGV